MARRAAKRLVGISDDRKDTNWGDPIPTCIRSRCGHTRRIGLTSYRVQNYTEDKNEEAMRLQLDLVDEVRAVAEQRLARYQNLMSKNYDSKVRHRDFQIGDLVLQKVMGATKDPAQGKLGPNWEGPYRITSWHRKGTYHLETMDGRKLQHPWNTEHLRRYY